jgi:hypothetical protein
MDLRRLFLPSLPVLALVAVACFTDPVFPGEQVLGTFRFDATLDRSRTTCTGQTGEPVQLSDAGVLRFSGTWSRKGDGGTGFLTVQDFARSAEYEGQRAVSRHRVTVTPATFPNCGTACEGSQIEETLDTLLLSSSQDELIGRNCSGLVDGGVPEDGGAQVPGPTPNGYDVQRACGTLTDEFIPGTKNCTCTKGCRAVYTVEGVRVD